MNLLLIYSSSIFYMECLGIKKPLAGIFFIMPPTVKAFAFRIAKIQNVFENKNIFENVFVFVIKNSVFCGIKDQNVVFMARNYEALVQVGFRTKREIKDKIAEQAAKANKGISEYLAEIVENAFEKGQETFGTETEPQALDKKIRQLFLDLYLSAPFTQDTTSEMLDTLINLAKTKKIARVKDW